MNNKTEKHRNFQEQRLKYFGSDKNVARQRMRRNEQESVTNNITD